jgi:hypothetical protein
VLLELSLETAAAGSVPKITKHQLAVAMKRRSGLDIKVDKKLWDRFMSFYEKQVMSQLRLVAAASDLPALAAERMTGKGAGGDPDTSQALFWLCLDSDRGAKEQRSSEAQLLEQGSQSEPDRATEVSTSIEREAKASELPKKSEAQTVSTGQAPATNAESTAVGQGSRSIEGTTNCHLAASDTYLLWFAVLRPVAVMSSSTSVTLALALALLIPTLIGATTDIFQPVQALAESISALIDVFNGSMAIRT